VRHHRTQHSALVLGQDFLEFAAGATRLLGFAHGQHDLDVGGQQQIAPLDAVASLAFDEPLGTAEPARRPTHLASECKVHAHPERAAHGAHRFTTVQVHVIGTLQAAQALVVAAEHEGRCCELFEVLRSERRRPIGA
jgi:hypothetical protein